MVAHPFSLAAGEYLFREGDPGDRMSLLASGSVDGRPAAARRARARGRAAGAGALIGEMGLLAERPRRSRRAPRRPPPAGASPPPRSAGSERRSCPRSCGGSGAWPSSGCATTTSSSPPSAGRTRARRSLAPRRARRRRPGRGGGARARGDRLPGDRALLQPLQPRRARGAVRRPAPAGGAARRPVVAACEQGPALLIVLRGAVESRSATAGSRPARGSPGPGRIVGHLNLDGQPTPVVSRARERSILLEVPLDRVAQIIDRGDDTGRRFGGPSTPTWSTRCSKPSARSPAWPRRAADRRDTARTMSQGNVDAVRTCLEGWNRGDIDAWLNAVHPEIEWYSEVAGRWRAPRRCRADSPTEAVLGRVARGLEPQDRRH